MVGVLSTARNLAFIPISLSIAYLVRGELGNAVFWLGGKKSEEVLMCVRAFGYLFVSCVEQASTTRVCVNSGVGRFNNRTYLEFLRSWNATRRMKTKIGPAEVCCT